MTLTRLALVGYRGCGKSTIGPILAARLGWDFLDADGELVRRRGQTIREIFNQHGEAAFRDAESQLLEEVLQRPNLVLATGGGVILREENRERLRSAAYVVYLELSAAELWERIQADPQTLAQRPNLTAAGGLAEVEELLARRQPAYASTAHLQISAGGLSPEALADAILCKCPGGIIFPSWPGRSLFSPSA
ncbi:MAG: shikimate kinase [Gemmataceae bacterium]